MSGSEIRGSFEAARNFFAHKSSHPPCLPGVVRKGEQDDVRRKGATSQMLNYEAGIAAKTSRWTVTVLRPPAHRISRDGSSP